MLMMSNCTGLPFSRRGSSAPQAERHLHDAVDGNWVPAQDRRAIAPGADRAHRRRREGLLSAHELRLGDAALIVDDDLQDDETFAAGDPRLLWIGGGGV